MYPSEGGVVGRRGRPGSRGLRRGRALIVCRAGMEGGKEVFCVGGGGNEAEVAGSR